ALASPSGSSPAIPRAPLSSSLSSLETLTKSGPLRPPLIHCPAARFFRQASRIFPRFIATPQIETALERQNILHAAPKRRNDDDSNARAPASPDRRFRRRRRARQPAGQRPPHPAPGRRRARRRQVGADRRDRGARQGDRRAALGTQGETRARAAPGRPDLP